MGTIIHFQQFANLFVPPEYIRIQKRLRNTFTPRVARSTAVPSFCRLELPLWTYGPIKTLSFFMKSANFIMLYTGDFVLHYYVRFSQIRSQI